MASDASQNTRSPLQPALGIPSRFVTTHDKEGNAIFSTAFPESLVPYEASGMIVYEGYETFTSPPPTTDEADIKALAAAPHNTGVIPFPKPGGTVLRICDWAPGAVGAMHRHESLDYGIMTHGELEAVMGDSGEVRRVRVGDCVVQRGTMHAWRNPSKTEHARMVFVIVGAAPVVVNGEEKRQDLTEFAK